MLQSVIQRQSTFNRDLQSSISTVSPAAAMVNYPETNTQGAHVPEVRQVKLPSRSDAHPVRFGLAGGALGALSWTVDLLQNRAVELTVTDFLGMCVPRSYVEYKQRGWDSARENIIRETTAMMFNVFVAGWIAIATLKLLMSKVGRLNPLGMNHQAWLDADALDIYIRKIYKPLLLRPEIKTPKDAEKAFVRTILSGLQSTGSQAGNQSYHRISQQVLGHDAALLQRITQNMPSNGRLTPEAIEVLTDYFTKPFDGIVGKSDLMPRAAERVQRMSQYQPELSPHEFAVERMELSKALLGFPEKRFLNFADPVAKLGGLTDQVNLVDENGKVILPNRSRTNTLKQMRYTLHEIIDRAHHTADGLPLDTSTPEWKEKVLASLYNPRPKGFWEHLLPKSQDSLMDYMLKSERFTTALPLALTIAGAISVAFLNNYLTKKHHGGKVFSPIEEGLRDKMRKDAESPPSKESSASLQVQSLRQHIPGQRQSSDNNVIFRLPKQRQNSPSTVQVSPQNVGGPV